MGDSWSTPTTNDHRQGTITGQGPIRALGSVGSAVPSAVSSALCWNDRVTGLASAETLVAAGIAELRGRFARGGAGPAGGQWCDQLPELVARLMERWQLTGTPQPARAGYGGIAVFVTRADRTPAVLKVTFSVQTRDLENDVLAAWSGRSAAQLLERDDSHHARLLERLAGPPLSALTDPVAAMTIGGELAADLAVRAPEGLPRLADHAAQIAAAIRGTRPDRLRSLTIRDRDTAAATYLDLGADQPDTLLHGDLQGSNILRSARGGWAVIDPLGMVGEVALEALTMLRDRWTDLSAAQAGPSMLDRQLAAFAEAAGTPRSRVIAWTHARAVRAVLEGINDDNAMHEWVASHLDPNA